MMVMVICSSKSYIQVSKESGNPVTWMKEDNYMFKLSEFSDRLHKWLDTGGELKHLTNA
jgi:methionyl-tRNA synthetase